MKIFKQNANENPFNTCGILQKELTNLITSFDFNLYPDSNYTELRREIALFSAVTPEKVICSNGSDELLKIIAETFTKPGDVVISHSPTFMMYKKSTELRGATYYETEPQKNLMTCVDALIELSNSKKAKLVYLCNPNNPTGSFISKDEIVKLITKTSGVIVVDEAYIDFAESGASAIDLTQLYDRLIVLRTFSKGYAMAGLRIGYAIANEKLIQALNQSRQPYNLNSLTAAIAIIAIKNASFFEARIQNIKDERSRIKNILDQNQIAYLPSWTNFFLIKSLNAKRISETLQQQNIFVRTFDESLLNTYFRFSIGSPQQNDAIINVIINEMAQNKKKEVTAHVSRS